MIDKENIEKIVTEFLQGSDKFLCNVQIKQGNIITITIDSDSFVSIEDCIHLSKSIEMKLNRDIEDFELRVSSFGADQPLRFHRQYLKNIGRQISIITVDEHNITGILKNVESDKLKVELSVKKKVESATIQEIPFKEIKETRVVLMFK